MGMPITIEIVGEVNKGVFVKVFNFFKEVDARFSTYKKDSEVSKINRGELVKREFSSQMLEVLKLAEKTKKETDGYFDVFHKGIFDPSGIVKGWGIQKAVGIIRKNGYKNFYVDAGGDIQAMGNSSNGRPWKVGIRNPFNRFENVKIVKVSNCAIATSGTYIRGNHIYNPHGLGYDEIVSISVLGKNIMDVDRFATAAFAMGRKGIYFLEQMEGYEGYMIDRSGKATFTSGINIYLESDGNN